LNHDGKFNLVESSTNTHKDEWYERKGSSGGIRSEKGTLETVTLNIRNMKNGAINFSTRLHTEHGMATTKNAHTKAMN